MTDKEEELVKHYPEASLLVELAKAAWTENLKAARVDFSLSERLKTELRKLLDKDVKSIFITDSDVRHIKKNHGQGEARRGQENITPEDFAIIPAVMNEFDTAQHENTDSRGNKKVLFVKKVNGTVYTASVERGNNQLGVITLWKTKARSGA
jgi:predicted Zn-dependent protease